MAVAPLADDDGPLRRLCHDHTLAVDRRRLDTDSDLDRWRRRYRHVDTCRNGRWAHDRAVTGPQRRGYDRTVKGGGRDGHVDDGPRVRDWPIGLVDHHVVGAFAVEARIVGAHVPVRAAAELERRLRLRLRLVPMIVWAVEVT